MKKIMIDYIFPVLLTVLYLTMVALWISIPEEVTLNVATTGAALAFTSLYLILVREKVVNLYTSNFFKKMISSCISACLVFAILGVINYIAFKNPKAVNISKSQMGELSGQTKKLLKNMDEKLVIRFFGNINQYPSINSEIDKYRIVKKNIDLNFIDVDVRPEEVNKYSIKKTNSLHLSYKDKSQVIEGYSEEKMVDAFRKLLSTKVAHLYYSVGHGELDLTSKEGEQSAFLGELIKREGHRISQIKLSSISKIEDSIDTLIILGPAEKFLKQEIEIIDDYLKRGGSLLVAIDPNLNSDKLVGLRELLKKWGIEINNNLVIDRISYIKGSNGTVPVANKILDHQITKNFQGQYFFPFTSAIREVEGQKVGAFWPLMESNLFPASWIESNPKELVKGKIQYHENEDLKGPAVYVAALEQISSNGKRARIVAFGTSKFINNKMQSFTGHFNLFLNAISWQVNQSAMIALDRPNIKVAPVFISRNHIGIIFYFSIVLVPIVMMISSFVFYRRRVVS